MQITVINDDRPDEQPYSFDVNEQMTITDLKALLEEESKIPCDSQKLYLNGNELTDLKSLKDLANEIIIMKRVLQQNASSNSHADSNHDFDIMRQHVLQDPRLLQQLESTNPELAQAARTNPERFSAMVQQIEQTRRHAETQKEQLAALNDDPFDVEAQKKIEEAIRKENVAANLEAAMEYNPESFARVTRLYINVEINGKHLVALVDSGAQSTVISPETAESCGLMRLLDTRFSGVAKGVGTAKILGRIHSAQMRLSQNLFLTCSFIVVEGKGSELLFGLDMLKKHRANIDLCKNALTFDTCDIPFLAEHELPEKQRRMEIHGGDDDDIAPSEVTKTIVPQIGSSSTAQVTSSGATATISDSPPVTGKYPEKDIKILIDMGVSRKEAENALEMAGGNPDLAASLLF